MPGLHCFAVITSSPTFGGLQSPPNNLPVVDVIIIITLFSVTMAVVTSSDRFALSLSYALSQLGTPELTLKAEQQQAIRAVDEENDVFVWLLTDFGKSSCF